MRADIERKEMIAGFVAIMDEVLCIDGNGGGREGYVSGVYECAERITDAVLGGIKAAGDNA